MNVEPVFFFFLNTGIWLVILQSFVGLNWYTFTGRLLEVLAVVLFVLGNWKRIKPLGSQKKDLWIQYEDQAASTILYCGKWWETAVFYRDGL